MTQNSMRSHLYLIPILLHSLTVVRIHIRQATLAPIAQAPAVPPLTAEAAALFKISESVGFGSALLIIVF